MKNLIWIILMSASFTSLAQRYVLFNPVCMERQKYDVINGYGGESYITYAIELNDNEKVFLEVGKESEKYESRISRAVITCNSSSINRALVNKVNTGAERIFIVLKEGQGRFRVSPVATAAYFKNSDRGIEYTGKDFSFTYSDLINTSSQNLANPNVGGRVFFVGASQYECMSAYTFSVSTQQNSNVGSDLTILPSIGVIEYRTNLSGGVGTRRLTNVNAKNFRSIIQDKCNEGEGSFDNDLTDRGGVEEPPLVTNRPPETTRPTRPQERPTTTTRPNTTTNTNVRPSNNPADYGIIARHTGSSSTTVGDVNNAVDRNTQPSTSITTTNDDMHTVAKGETLFRIAKKYGITVNQLKDWNNLTSNTIFVGTELYVSSPTAVRDEGTLADRGGNMNTNRPVTNTSDRNTDTNTSFDTQAEYHILKRGETLAGVARLYGFTEEKFRQMNGLFPNESLPIGYRLKTSDCDCPAQDDYYNQRDNNRGNDDYYRDEFVDRGDNMDNGFDDVDFRKSVNTPAPYENDRYDRIDATRTQIPLRDTRRTSSNDSFGSRPDSFEDNNFRRLDARGTTFDDRNGAASTTSFNQSSGLDIRFDRQEQLHLVKENETLYSIARKYRTTVSRLAEANNLDPREVLLPGQSIFVK